MVMASVFNSPVMASVPSNSTVWHVVWTGGQSNAVGTNSQPPGQYPAWPTSPYIQNFCWSPLAQKEGIPHKPMTSSQALTNLTTGLSCVAGEFSPAKVPLINELNVGFSQAFANLLLATLPNDHGVVLLNTGVGGTGFVDGRWVAPDGDLTKQSIAAVQELAAALPDRLGGSYRFHTMLWHQGECDAGDNHHDFHSSYCHYLQDDIGPLVDHLRASFPGAAASTPFIAGGMLPFWVDAVNGTDGVASALDALNTSRPFTGTAHSRIFPDFFPGTKTPDGEPIYRSGVTGDVIHFNATQAVLMGHQYWAAALRAAHVEQVVPSTKTRACAVEPTPPS